MGKAIWIGGAISFILAVWKRAVAFSAARLVFHLNEAVHMSWKSGSWKSGSWKSGSWKSALH
jgi:hypothetical protein